VLFIATRESCAASDLATRSIISAVIAGLLDAPGIPITFRVLLFPSLFFLSYLTVNSRARREREQRAEIDRSRQRRGARTRAIEQVGAMEIERRQLSLTSAFIGSPFAPDRNIQDSRRLRGRARSAERSLVLSSGKQRSGIQSESPRVDRMIVLIGIETDDAPVIDRLD